MVKAAMPRTQGRSKRKPSAGPQRTVARPLDMLVFLLPLIIFYEIAFLSRHDRVIAFDMLLWFFDRFGHIGVWAPGVAIVLILLATHIVSGEPWRVNWQRVGLMYIEAPLLALPLLAMNWYAPLAAPRSGGASSMLAEIAQGVGAGIYEELIFRLVLISLIVIIGADLMRIPRSATAVFAVIIASLAFAAHHHEPFGGEPFGLFRFAFRAVAGVYLAVVFWYRGYALAAGSHAAYNASLVLLTQFASS